MPIPVLNYQARNNIYQDIPELAGAKASSDLLGHILENQKKIIEQKYIKPEMDRRMQLLQYNLDMMKPKAEMAQQFTESELAKALLEPDKMRADIAETWANVKSKSTDNLIGTGITSQVLRLEQIRNKYGESSPVYQMAKRALESEIGLKESRQQFFGSNVALKNIPEGEKEQFFYRYNNAQAYRQAEGKPIQKFDDWYNEQFSSKASQLKTEHQEQDSLSELLGQEQNILPEVTGVTGEDTLLKNSLQQALSKSNIPIEQQIAPSEQVNVKKSGLPFEQMAQASEAGVYKKFGDPKAVQSAQQMSNAYAILNAYDPVNLAKYSGPSGTIDYLKDVGKMLSTGKAPNEAVKEFENFKKVAQTVIKDAERAGYNTSVTPYMIEQLDDQLKSLYAGSISPDVALYNYYTLKNSIKDYAIQRTHNSRFGPTPLTDDKYKLYEAELDREANRIKKSYGENRNRASNDLNKMLEAKKKNNNNNIKGAFSQKDWEYTAKKYGTTVEEIKKRLGY